MSLGAWEQLGTVARTATSSTIAARLQETIRATQLPAGSLLPPERDLAAQLGVSRATVREAIHELTLRGIVERRQGVGTILLSTSERSEALLGQLTRTERDMREVTDFRSVFEPQISSLAAARRTDSDLILLRHLCEGDARSLSPEESFDLDHRFHETIAASTHNQLILTLSRASSEYVRDFRRISHSSSEGRETSMDGHLKILAAIAAADPDAAAAAMREHIDVVGRLRPQ